MALKKIYPDAQNANVRREDRVAKSRALWIVSMALKKIYSDVQNANVSRHPKRERTQYCAIRSNAHYIAKMDMQRIRMAAKNAVALMVGS